MPAKLDIFEALLYAVGDEGLESERVESLLDMNHDEVEQLASDFSSGVFRLRRYGGQMFFRMNKG